MKKVNIFLFVLLSLCACKENGHAKNCLTVSDDKIINTYFLDMKKAIESNDREKIKSLIEFPIQSGLYEEFNSTDFTKNEYLFSMVSSYLVEDLIDKKENSDLKRSVNYISDNDSKCHIYEVSNIFPEQEFAVFFYLEKINGKIKLVKIDFAG
ncbi:hypothetical protein GO009_10885 [Muricauda sp. TY007]|uniref:hypothetical protein n=1 Tax=Allomuricauda sp. TY007 TaxID=2683200 RepID=UPI0013C07F5C|nr:hypothetical protein [Muricauda sp. TY007]NDV16531.1 hypothetical protein [Muricauda sp. TY007]